MDFNLVTFTDSNGEPVAYDGSEVTWRVSAYAVIVSNNQVLLVRGKDEKLFDVVGGGVEFGELANYLPLAAVFGTVYSLVYLATYYLVASGSRYSLAVPGFVGLMMGAIVYWGTGAVNIAWVAIGFSLALLAVLTMGVLREIGRASGRERV